MNEHGAAIRVGFLLGVLLMAGWGFTGAVWSVILTAGLALARDWRSIRAAMRGDDE